VASLWPLYVGGNIKARFGSIQKLLEGLQLNSVSGFLPKINVPGAKYIRHPMSSKAIPKSYLVALVQQRNPLFFQNLTDVSLILELPIHLALLVRSESLREHLQAVLSGSRSKIQFRLSTNDPATFLDNFQTLLDVTKAEDEKEFLDRLKKEKSEQWMEGFQQLVEQLGIANLE